MQSIALALAIVDSEEKEDTPYDAIQRCAARCRSLHANQGMNNK